MANAAIESLLISPDLTLGRWGNLSVVIWRERPTLAGAGSLDRHYRSMIARYPSGFASLIVIEEQTPNPDDPLRRAITSTMDGAGDHLKAVAVVLEAKGFAAAALRAALTSMSMVTSSRFPRRFVSSVDEALPWMTASIHDDAGHPASARAIARDLSGFRRSLPGPGDR